MAFCGIKHGTISSVRDENAEDILADVELLHLAFPRHAFTLSQIMLTVDRVKWLYDTTENSSAD